MVIVLKFLNMSRKIIVKLSFRSKKNIVLLLPYIANVDKLLDLRNT
jgi:hypothetical protein